MNVNAMKHIFKTNNAGHWNIVRVFNIQYLISTSVVLLMVRKEMYLGSFMYAKE
jgi:hypothetical protein